MESSQSFNATDGLENANGTKYCVHAAISIGYNGNVHKVIVNIFSLTISQSLPSSLLLIPVECLFPI